MHHQTPKTLLPFLLLLLFALPVIADTPAPTAAVGAFAGHWEGEIEVPGRPIGVKVDLAHEGAAWSGTIDIPMQGAMGLPLEIVEAGAETIRFKIPNIPGAPTFAGKLEDGKLRGEFSQGGATIPFTLGRDVKLAEPNRPQTPQPPFPYRVREVEYPSGDITLAGTLTMPEGPGPHPAVLLITGSGTQDRDETLFSHKPFFVIADHLTRANIAVLRVDDRGAGGSGGDPSTATSADFAEDVRAGVAWLKSRTRIAKDQIGLLGHSEGGLIAPMVAATSEDVAFLVLLAGPGVPGDEILIKQTDLLLKVAGVPAALHAQQMEAQQETFALLNSDKSDEEIRAAMEEIARGQIAAAGQDASELKDQVKAQIDRAMSPWFRFFLSYDPRPDLRKVKVPVLALNGELDLQVDAQQNLPEIAAALKEGGNEHVTTKSLPQLNHLFQKATTGNPEEYAVIETTIEPEVLDIVRDWILETTARTEDAPSAESGD